MNGEIGVSQGTISYEASKDLILIRTVQLKIVIKAQQENLSLVVLENASHYRVSELIPCIFGVFINK